MSDVDLATPLPCQMASWVRGRTKRCPNRAKYEAHMTEGNFMLVCGRHLRGFNWHVALDPAATEPEETP